MSLTLLKDTYKKYKQLNPNSKVSEAKANIIWREFKDIVIDEILLEGKEFDMGHRLSTIKIIRQEKTHSNPKIDWNETNKLRDENGELPKDKDGNSIIVYYTDKWYMFCFWDKHKMVVKNGHYYNFKLLRSDFKKGFGPKKRLTELLKNDDTAFLTFELKKKKIYKK